jgi:hypothetical protein
MSLTSTYQLRNSLPIRSGSRPRSLSLAEYQPLSFDREALEAAYQASLNGSSNGHVASWRSHPSQTSGRTSNESNDTGGSTLSRNLKPGDNPHLPPRPVAIPPAPQEPPPGGIAGVGAGHSLTPPQSPFHKQGQLHHQRRLSGGLQSPVGITTNGHNGKGKGSSQDYHGALDWEDFEAAGYETDPGPVVSGRRALPQVPTNVPPPVSTPCDRLIRIMLNIQELPAWE